MSLPALDNLVRIGQLKAEPRNVAEVTRMLAMAHTRLSDAKLASLSPEGRFISAYNAAHAAALAVLRWHGYRSEHRYTVSSASRTRWAGRHTAGGFSTRPIRSETWPNAKATWRSGNRPLKNSAPWWPT